MRKLLLLLLPFVLIASWGKWDKKGHWNEWAKGGNGGGPPPTDSIGAEWNLTGNPIGGGIGYDDIIDYTSLSNNHTTSFLVTTSGTPEDSFAAFMTLANTGDTIFIRADVELDFTDNHYDVINAGVLVAGDRGATVAETTSWGALIKTSTIESSAEILRMSANTRVTGLRFRGHWSELNNIPLTDSVSDYAPSVYYALLAAADSIEIDNCEFWGWSGAPVNIASPVGSDGFNIHHNYLHHSNAIYKTYPWNCTGKSEGYSLTGNLSHTASFAMWGGGSGSGSMYGNVSYNIVTPKVRYNTFNWHSGTDDSVPTDTIFNNTFWNSCYVAGGNVFGGTGSHNEDSAYIYNNWFMRDSAECFGDMGGVRFHAVNNQFSTDPPDGVSNLNPTATIVASDTSGTNSLTVKFTATGSSDPDGSITTYHWWFGDSAGSDNTARVTTHNDTVSHTYGEIGLYTVELLVQDDDGLPAWAYQNILVEPESGIWLSAWVNDRSHEETTYADWYYKQILIGNDTVYNKDLAGANGWEHVILDISSEVGASDSVTVEFRLACAKDTSNALCGPWALVDNIYVFGGTVVASDFEGETWSGNYYGRNSANWDGGYSGNTMKAIEENAFCFGLKGYRLYNDPTTGAQSDGDYSFVKQKIDILGQ